MQSSKWKSPFQKSKKERQQPAARGHLGILEKKKDFLARAKIFHKHEKEMRDLKRAAELRNPDEFYFSMISDMKEKPIDYKSKSKDDFTKEQKLLLETRDMNYIMSKMVSQRKKLEKLRIRLPVKTNGAQKIFNSVEEAIEATKNAAPVDENPEEEERKDIVLLRDEIEQRENILTKLEEVYTEMKVRKETKDDPNFKEVEDDEGNVSREWKRERKR